MITASQHRNHALADARLAVRQVRFEQIALWRNPVGAIFTVGFSVIIFLLVGGSAGHQSDKDIGNQLLIQYYLGTFTALGVMTASFTNLCLTLVQRRESGQLKRLRLSPLPISSYVGGVILNVLCVVALQLATLLLVGHFAYHGHLPGNWAAFAVAVIIGVVCFASLAMGVSSLVPNAEAGGPVVNIFFFVLVFISGVWFPLTPGSGLAKIAAWFPVRHFVLAVFAPFDRTSGASPWAWTDLRDLVIWAAVGVFIAIRRFSFEPRRH